MTKSFTRIGVAVALLATAAALAGCGDDSTTAPRSGGIITAISSNVIVVGHGNSLSFGGEADSVLALDFTGEAPEVSPGDIVVGSENDGYIRRVRAVRAEGGRLWIDTSPAFLADAIISGGIDTTVAVGFGAPAKNASPDGERLMAGETALAPLRGLAVTDAGLTFDFTQIYGDSSLHGSVDAVIERGRVEFAPNVSLSLTMGLNHLSTFRAVVEGDLTFQCTATFDTSDPVTVDRVVPLAETKRTFVQRIGEVPVVEVVTLRFVAHLTMDSKLTGYATAGIATTGHVRNEILYSHRRWSSAYSAPSSFGDHMHDFEGPGTGDFELAIVPEISIELYGLESVDLALGPRLGFSLTQGAWPVREWELDAGLEGRARYSHGALEERTREYDSPVRSRASVLESGPFRTGDYIYVMQWGGSGTVIGDDHLIYPKGIAVNAAGNLLVTDNVRNVVLEFEPGSSHGNYWGGTAGGTLLNAPEKIAVDESGFVYVVDGGSDRIQKFTADGTFVTTWGSVGSGEGQFHGPIGVAAAGGFVYVTDSQNHRVERFTTEGAFIGAWGEYGVGPGQFDTPSGIAVVRDDGTVLVADCHNSRVQRFTATGEYLGSWGGPGQGNGQFDCAIDVTVAPGGDIFVTDLGNNRFQRFTPEGAFVTALGSSGTGMGQFDHPESVAVDSRGWVYVVDSRNTRVQVFAPPNPAR